MSVSGVSGCSNSDSVSSRFRALATDHEIWKARYYDAWVKSRIRRRTLTQQQDKSRDLTKAAQLLEHGQRSRLGGTADWKRLYKIRRNWDIGAARVREIEIAQPPSAPAVAKVHQNMVFTVDKRAGLRAWSQRDGTRALRSQIKMSSSAEPTCMAVDTIDGNLGFSLASTMVDYHSTSSEMRKDFPWNAVPRHWMVL